MFNLAKGGILEWIFNSIENSCRPHSYRTDISNIIITLSRFKPMKGFHDTSLSPLKNTINELAVFIETGITHYAPENVLSARKLAQGLKELSKSISIQPNEGDSIVISQSAYSLLHGNISCLNNIVNEMHMNSKEHGYPKYADKLIEFTTQLPILISSFEQFKPVKLIRPPCPLKQDRG